MSMLPPPGDDHYPGLEGASPVGTHNMYRCKELVQGVIQDSGLGAVYGGVGLGKTFAGHDTLRELAPDATRVVELPPGANKGDIHGALWECLELDGDVGDTKRPHEKILKALGAEFRVLLVDEVQLLSAYALEYLRYLWEHTKGERPAVVFIGSGNARQRILHSRPLHSRIHDWQQFNPLAIEEVLDVIPLYHPAWEGTDPELIKFGDDRGCHGNFRSWAHTTSYVTKALREDPKLTLDKNLILWALNRLDPTAAFPGR